MPLEQLDLFESEMSVSEALFKRFGLTPEFNEKYFIRTKEGRVNDYRTVKNVAVAGTLIKYDDNAVALSDVWIKSERQLGTQDDEGYAEFIEIPVGSIGKIEVVEPFHFETHIGSPYRIEMYKNAQKTKETTWMSCFYRGITINGKIILVNFGDNNKIIVCNKDEIKGFYPLSLDESPKKTNSGE